MTVVKPLAVAAHPGSAVTAGQPAGGAAPFQASFQDCGPGTGPGDSEGPATAPWDQCAEGAGRAEGVLGTGGPPVQAPIADAARQESRWSADPGSAGEVTAAPEQAPSGSAEGAGCGPLESPSPFVDGEALPAPSGNGVAPDQAQALRRPPSNNTGADASAAASGLSNMGHRGGAHAGDGQGGRADAPGQRSQAPDGAQAGVRAEDVDDARPAPSTGCVRALQRCQHLLLLECFFLRLACHQLKLKTYRHAHSGV